MSLKGSDLSVKLNKQLIDLSSHLEFSSNNIMKYHFSNFKSF